MQSLTLIFNHFSRMSLEFDPEFVDTKVKLLESDIAR